MYKISHDVSLQELHVRPRNIIMYGIPYNHHCQYFTSGSRTEYVHNKTPVWVIGLTNIL